ncbi:MAG: metallophosphoesterase, partial [Pseudomonadota bacterium]
MRKILVATDLHLLPSGETLIGLDPAARLGAVLSDAVAHHPDAERLVLLGDLTHHGTPEEYGRLTPLLRDLPWPVSFLIGNHDDRRAFKAAVPEAPVDDNGFVQSIVDFDDLRLVTLDTHDPDARPLHSGRLCAQRLHWLDWALATAGARPCLVFMHHPPIEVGMTGMDRIALQDAGTVRQRLKDAGVRHAFAGHIHRTITATVDDLSVTIFRSPCHQMPMR